MVKNTYRRTQTGFSLLELILVVTLIGILSAVALPKYLQMSASANIAVLQGMKLTLDDAASFTYNKSVLAGNDSNISGIVSIHSAHPLEANSDSNPFAVKTRYGYPQGTWSAINKISELDKQQWHYSEQQGQPAVVVLWSDQGPGSASSCNIRYQGAIEAGYRPQITINETGC